MPELPEVETVRRVLEPQIAGRTIEKMTLRRPEIIAHPSVDLFSSGVVNQTISGLSRRGKFLVMEFRNGGRMVLHLRMTGCLLLTPAEYPEEKHTHILFALNSGSELRFSDVRRFGRFWYIFPGEQDTFSGIHKLGIEPLNPCGEPLTAACLKKIFGRRKKTIKECLMDQSALAGIGNIYADEILFAAGICPRRPARSLRQREWKTLSWKIPERLRYFIDKNDITPGDYLSGRGRDYRNTPFLQVYGRAGLPCPVCRSALCREVLGGRSSVFCPNCQK